MRQSIAVIFLFSLIRCSYIDTSTIDFPKGGYDYVNVTSKNDSQFFFLPARSSFSQKDSVLMAFHNFYLYHSFNEPNISLHPPDKPIIRFHYADAFDGSQIIITLKEESIIVKEGIKGYPTPAQDDRKLDSLERLHYELVRWQIPNYKKWRDSNRIKYVETYIKRYPQLLDGKYHYSLLDKAKVMEKEPFVYTTKRIQISKRKYTQLVNLINESAYWRMPFRNDNCKGVVSDAGGYTLEAATPQGYNVVSVVDCPDDTSRLTKACQELIDLAHLRSKLNLLWNGTVIQDTN